jgi:hypothetical protein
VFDGKNVTQRESSESPAADSGAETATAADPGIRCGANDWCPSSMVCCMKLGASGWFGPPTPCSAPGTCTNFSQFACDTLRGCVDAGASTDQSCCATRESETTEFQGSSCVPTGACVPASLAVVLCAPTDPEPCQSHQSCVAADAGELPPGYYACQ